MSKDWKIVNGKYLPAEAGDIPEWPAGEDAPTGYALMISDEFEWMIFESVDSEQPSWLLAYGLEDIALVLITCPLDLIDLRHKFATTSLLGLLSDGVRLAGVAVDVLHELPRARRFAARRFVPSAG